MNKKKMIAGNSHYTALDGLRGFATILVVLYHYLSGYTFFTFGWTGIELFFILSGFLISARLIPFINQKGILLKFYWNRFLRIVPLYYLFLIVFFSCWFLLTSYQSQQDGIFYKKHYWQFFLFIQNWVYIIDFSQSNNHLQHLWSLAIEEQIYLLYPFYVIALNNKKKFLPITLALIITILIARTTYYYYTKDYIDFKQIYWNTFFRADSFLCGVATYLVFTKYKNKLKKWISIVGIASVSVLLVGIIVTKSVDKSNPFFTTIGRTFLALSFCYLMWRCISFPQNWVSHFFSSKFLVFTGKISYGIFIFHWPIFLTGFAIINKLLIKFNLPIYQTEILIVNALISVFLTVLISYFSFRHYESFFLKYKKRYNYSIVS